MDFIILSPNLVFLERSIVAVILFICILEVVVAVVDVIHVEVVAFVFKVLEVSNIFEDTEFVVEVVVPEYASFFVLVHLIVYIFIVFSKLTLSITRNIKGVSTCP